MNSRIYKKFLYHVRDIHDIRHLINSSCEMFSNDTAYFTKNRPGGKYLPVKYKKVREDVLFFGTSLAEMGLLGKKVAVIGENSYEWIVAYFSVVCGGGIIIPIDRELPAEEIANLLNRSGAEAIIFSKKMEATIKKLGNDENSERLTICMSSERKSEGLNMPDMIQTGRIVLSEGNRSFINVEINPDDCCAILYTSGTTGIAKGVMLSHKNIISNVQNMSRFVRVTKDDVGLSVLPMHHTYEMTCHIFTSFYQGMPVAICEGLKHIIKNMNEAQVTVMLAVPLIFESMHKKIFKTAQQKDKLENMTKAIKVSRKLRLYNNLPLMRKIFKEVHELTGNRIRLFIAGGAAIDPKVVQDFEAMGFPMIQGYGMTEASPIIAVNMDRYSKADAVGLVMPGTEVEIIEKDKDGIGEIIVKSDSVMLGYYQNPEATEEATKDGWLYTGDYGYMTDDGFLYVSGRKKNVIVTKNGKNIFPEEVEYYLIKNEYIAEAVVYGVPDERTGGTVVKAEVYPDYAAINEDLGQFEKEEIERLMNHIIRDINDKMPTYKRILRVSVRETEFEKTTTRKIKRHNL
ncbi:MAG: AMP-binding protein [Eubacteriales bacterium]|nr:AMP-binding protein [Eubacteriales bacterium]MDD4390077.1 AMP-binding protein [Eubacteriales bacterium]